MTDSIGNFHFCDIPLCVMVNMIALGLDCGRMAMKSISCTSFAFDIQLYEPQERCFCIGTLFMGLIAST